MKTRATRLVWHVLALGSTLLALTAGRGAAVDGALPALRDRTPRFFEPNVGQVDPHVAYFARGNGFTLWLTERGPWWSYLVAPRKSAPSGELHSPHIGLAIAMRWLDSDGPRGVRTGSPLAARISNFVGASGGWRSAAEVYREVAYEDVYPGIDLVFREAGGRLRYDWVVAAGADPGRIRVRFEGADDVWVDGEGRLVLETALGQARQSAPRSFQIDDRGARVEIPSRWEVDRDGTATFALAGHDPRRELVIDPVIDAATYLGIPGHLFHFRLALAEGSSPVVVTEDQTRTLPTTPGVFQPDHLGGRFDLVITRLDRELSGVDFMTYFGGTGVDDFPVVAIAPDGDIVVAARTQSTDLPTTPESHQPSFGGRTDLMLARIAADGSALRWVTYLGGSDLETVASVDVGADGTIAVGGTTGSTDFPLLNAADTSIEGPTFFAGREAYIASFDGDGTARWATYFGGSALEALTAVEIAADGTVFATGWTHSADLPVQNALWPTLSGGQDGWIATWSASGAAGNLTYYGSGFSDSIEDLAMDAAGNLYAIGIANSGSPPGVVPLVPNHDGGFFMLSLTPDLQALRYAVQAWRAPFARISVSHDGHAFGAVDTRAAVVPDVDPLDPVQLGPGGGTGDSGLLALDPAGNPTFVALLGDPGWEITTEVDHDELGNVVVMSGASESTGELPVTPDAYQLAPTSTNDGHLMRLVFNEFRCPASPASGCAAPGKAVVKLHDKGPAAKRKLVWNWLNGVADQSDFADPTATTSYTLCVYSDSTNVLEAIVFPAGACGGGDCWKQTKKGFLYKSKGSNDDGLARLLLKEGAGKAKISVKGTGAALDLSALPIAEGATVTVQLVKDAGSGTDCWESVFDAPATRSDATKFKDKF